MVSVVKNRKKRYCHQNLDNDVIIASIYVLNQNLTFTKLDKVFRKHNRILEIYDFNAKHDLFVELYTYKFI